MKSLERDFDSYQRYSVLADILHAAFADALQNKCIVKVLDLGAGADAITEKFLDGSFEIIRADTATVANDVSGVVVIKEGESLPFDDQSFDVVISMDVLEHVPTDDRKLFLSECSRVAKSLCLVAAPNGNIAVKEAESRVYGIYRKTLGEHEFFEEHARYGLPTSEQVIDGLNSKDGSLIEIDNVLLSSWEAFTVADILAYNNKETLPNTIPMHQWQNTEVMSCYENSQHYRKFYLSTHDSQILSSINKYKSKIEHQILNDEFDTVSYQLSHMHIDVMRKSLDELRGVLKEKDSYIMGLDNYCNEFREALHEKDNHIEGLDRLISNFHEALIVKDKHIAAQQKIIEDLRAK